MQPKVTMSTALSTSDFKVSAPARRGPVWPNWLREPLLHFIVLGSVLFAIDHWIASRTDDPHTIVVERAVDDEARQVFNASRGREPNAEELYALRRVWLDNEVLYREGLQLQLDKGDKSIRERVIFKSLSVIDAGTKLPPYDEDILRDWFEQHREKYDQPARYDFQEAVLTGRKSDSDVRSFVDALNAGAPGDAEAGLRVFEGRPHDNLVQSYGPEFASALEAAVPGQWRSLPSREGLRAVRLESVTPPQPADFEDLQSVVLQDWTDAMLSEQRSAAVRALAKKYTVIVATE
jgi:hypothetical protein